MSTLVLFLEAAQNRQVPGEETSVTWSCGAASLGSHPRSADTGWTGRSTRGKEQFQDAGHWGSEVRASAFHPPGVSALSPSLTSPPSQPQPWNDVGCPTPQSSRWSWNLPRMGLGESLKRGVLTQSAPHCLTFAPLFLKTKFIEIIHTHTHKSRSSQNIRREEAPIKKVQEGNTDGSQSVVLEPIPGDPTLTWTWGAYKYEDFWALPQTHWIRKSRRPCLTSTLIYSVYILLHKMVAQMVKNLFAMQETQVWFLGGEDPLDKEMATRSNSCLENSMDRGAWRAVVHGVSESNTIEQLTLSLYTNGKIQPLACSIFLFQKKWAPFSVDYRQ